METPPIIGRTPVRRWKVAALVILAGGAVAWLWRFAPGSSGLYPQCVLHRLTGWHCPGCGSLRAVHAALHGRFLESIHDNALLWATAGIVAYWLAKEWKAGRNPLEARASPRGVKFYLGLLLCFTAARNLPFAPFNLLAPLN